MDFTVGNICQLFIIPTEKSLFSMFWSVISFLWPWYWFAIIVGLTLWIYYEIKARNGNAHYNSENGFSPTFNRVVGSGTYFFQQGFVYLIFKILIGVGAYCLPLPYIIHILVFLSTGRLLNFVGFWPRLERPNQRKRWRKRRRY